MIYCYYEKHPCGYNNTISYLLAHLSYVSSCIFVFHFVYVTLTILSVCQSDDTASFKGIWKKKVGDASLPGLLAPHPGKGLRPLHSCFPPEGRRANQADRGCRPGWFTSNLEHDTRREYDETNPFNVPLINVP